MTQDKANPYCLMDIRRVERDAIHGVALAREAFRARDPQAAARVLGAVVEPDRQARVVGAVADFMQSNSRGKPGKKRTAKR